MNIIDFFCPKNSGKNIRCFTKVISLIYALAGFAAILIGFFCCLLGGDILVGILFIVGTPIALIFLHIPLWFIYAFCDIYDVLCFPKGDHSDDVKKAKPTTTRIDLADVLETFEQ